MERGQLVDQLRIPGTCVDAAHIVGKSSKRRVSRCPTAFAIPKCDRGVVETLQPRFGSLRARVRHADKGGGSDEVRPAWRPLRAPRSMGRVAWSRSRCVHRDCNRAGGNCSDIYIISRIYIILGISFHNNMMACFGHEMNSVISIWG